MIGLIASCWAVASFNREPSLRASSRQESSRTGISDRSRNWALGGLVFGAKSRAVPMRVSLNWLKDFVDIQTSPEELCRALTMSGLEVEGLEAVGQSLDKIVAAKILAVESHPSADRLSICHVDVGGETIQVVCGAPNLAVGAFVPLALPGVSLPNGTNIEASRIRGEMSSGMLLAEDEMGLTEDHSGIMVLPPDLTPGGSIMSAISLPDWVLDVSITPNRADCASVIGIAREIAAVTGMDLKRPEIELSEEGEPIETLTSVTVQDPGGCPRYAAGLIQGVTLRPSPFWMRYRLHQSGMRGINNVVDVTNYVMLELGQPLHAFDYNRLRENRIVVRRAEKGETFTTLDGQTHTLNEDTVMICDGERSVALAGVMGGLNSEIFAGTRDVLVESAYFDPVAIRRTSKRLGILTEASYRFERGIDIDGVKRALKRALSLLLRLAGGKIAKGLVDVYPTVHKRPRIDLRIEHANRFLGTSLSSKEMGGYLRALEMSVEELDTNVLKVEPPSFRVDITREVDLMEEVARLSGYDSVPATSPKVSPSEERDEAELVLSDQVRSIMVGLGFTEVITYSFISPESADRLGADEESPLRSFVKLLNPLSVDQSVMRTSLVPGLFAAAHLNRSHGEKALKLFEWGKVFIRREGEQLPDEPTFVAALMAGPFCEKTWYREERPVDYYDIKGACEALLRALGAEKLSFKKEGPSHGYHPDHSCTVHASGTLIGRLGEVSPGVMESYDLGKEKAYLFEMDMEALQKAVPAVRKFRPIVKYPAVYRDISLIVNRQLESARIVDIIRREGGELIEYAHIFDVYEGEKMGPSEKAIAFRISYRSSTSTLDGADINRLHEAIIEKIRQETGGRLREG
jgi:phenylalanyl-tRNA synthetase beta chain